MLRNSPEIFWPFICTRTIVPEKKAGKSPLENEAFAGLVEAFPSRAYRGLCPDPIPPHLTAMGEEQNLPRERLFGTIGACSLSPRLDFPETTRLLIIPAKLKFPTPNRLQRNRGKLKGNN